MDVKRLQQQRLMKQKNAEYLPIWADHLKWLCRSNETLSGYMLVNETALQINVNVRFMEDAMQETRKSL